MIRLPRLALVAVLMTSPALGVAQSVSFGQSGDISQPIEFTADNLSVDQKTGHATWSGNVVIAQGDMRLAADNVTVTYAAGGQQRISALTAAGNVTLVNGKDAAEAKKADYNVDTGVVVLTGDVILTQGASVLSGERVDVDLRTGRANATGRVRSIFQAGGQK